LAGPGSNGNHERPTPKPDHHWSGINWEVCPDAIEGTTNFGPGTSIACSDFGSATTHEKDDAEVF